MAEPAPIPPPARGAGPAARRPTYGERQAIAMSWLFGALAAFLLLGVLALGAAVVFNVGFGGWLIGIGAMGLVIVAMVVAVGSFILRPGR